MRPLRPVRIRAPELPTAALDRQNGRVFVVTRHKVAATERAMNPHRPDPSDEGNLRDLRHDVRRHLVNLALLLEAFRQNNHRHNSFGSPTFSRIVIFIGASAGSFSAFPLASFDASHARCSGSHCRYAPQRVGRCAFGAMPSGASTSYW